ncbi:hypothetical protein [Nocardia mexicana]|uniref:DUF7159 domain-containing protein n=1 Tax=Nocardia mexicana TaxID=279262 RepID=A0A370GTP8_9NOCA|nr:hypothetical protein [Nocardia mexicana]RDI45293.1 hypothetical protein DFR68_11362 [Nocardia mexicana]
MVARSVVTFGVSTERGAVQAVALLAGTDNLPERILHHRTQQIRGDGKQDLARAVETALDDLAAEIGADYEDAGAAVTYRDAAERRAIVTGLASGPWRTASLVSAKSAHLALARAMTWVAEFDNLVVCDVVPGYQGFSLISPDRDRVVAGFTTAGGTISKETMRPAVTAAWDQFDAAGVRPDAVVLIGSAAGDTAVSSALGTGFGASIVPCKVAAAGSAIGAALVVQPEATEGAEPGRARRTRGTTAVFAAASVLAGGLVVGGVYQVAGKSRTDSATTLTNARIAADTQRTYPVRDPAVRPVPAAEEEPGGIQSGRGQSGEVAVDPGAAPGEAATDVVTVDPSTVSWGHSDPERLGVRDFDSAPADSETSQPLVRHSDPESAPAAQSSVIPAPTVPVGAPNGSLLFPGEAAPPAVGTAEFGQWWENHWRMMVQWAAQMVPRA